MWSLGGTVLRKHLVLISTVISGTVFSRFWIELYDFSLLAVIIRLADNDHAVLENSMVIWFAWYTLMVSWTVKAGVADIALFSLQIFIYYYYCYFVSFVHSRRETEVILTQLGVTVSLALSCIKLTS